MAVSCVRVRECPVCVGCEQQLAWSVLIASRLARTDVVDCKYCASRNVAAAKWCQVVQETKGPTMTPHHHCHTSPVPILTHINGLTWQLFGRAVGPKGQQTAAGATHQAVWVEAAAAAAAKHSWLHAGGSKCWCCCCWQLLQCLLLWQGPVADALLCC